MEFTDSGELRRQILANQYLPEHLRERAKNDTSEYCRAEDADNLLEVDRLTGNGLIRFYVNDRNDEHCGLSLSGSASERL